jgi:hypothetical protein
MRLRLAAALFLLAASPALAAAEDCATWNGFKCQPLQFYLPNDRDYWTRFFPEQGYPALHAGWVLPSRIYDPGQALQPVRWPLEFREKKERGRDQRWN